MARAKIRDTHPHLLTELDPSEDVTIIGSLAPSSPQMVTWRCAVGHSWPAKVGYRTAGAGCLVCSNRLIVPGVNDLASQYPLLAEEWHPIRNPFTPDTVAAGSGKKVWWLCANQHEWFTTILSRSTGTGCPACYDATRAGRVSQPLADIAPELARQYVSAVNPTTIHQQSLSAKTVLPNSKVTVEWREESCGHSWEQTVEKRYASYRRGTLCGVCDGRFVSAGVNDLFTKHPHLLTEWNVGKNGEPPSTLSEFSNEPADWVCSMGHSYSSRISKRAQGQGCPVCSGKVVLIGGNDLASLNPAVAAEWHPTKNGLLRPDQFTANSGVKVWWVCEKNHEWKTVIASRNAGRGCHLCSSRVSKMETELADFLESLPVGGISRSDRTILPTGRELDIYIPSKRLGVEFNGVYWHSEAAGRGRQYHSDKLALAGEAGIRLVQVWEDDWVRNPGQVKRMLAHKLGVSSERTVFARKTVAGVVSRAEAVAFLNAHHVQGSAAGSFYLGLREKGSEELVALLVVKRERSGEVGDGLNIIRYATSVSVPGGFTKLLAHAVREQTPDYLVTFSDNCVSDGGLYERNGFVADKVLPPDYMYVVEGERKHKFGYRLKRFRNDPELLWEEGLTERQLADLNGIPRIWDAGKVRWVKNL